MTGIEKFTGVDQGLLLVLNAQLNAAHVSVWEIIPHTLN